MALTLKGFEGFETGDFNFGTSVGTLAQISSNVRAGTAGRKCMRCDGTAGTGAIYRIDPFTAHSSYSNNPSVLGFWVKWETFPTVTTTLLETRDNSAVLKWQLYFSSSQGLWFYDVDGFVNSYAWTPSLNTWYFFEIWWSNNATTGAWKLKVNGTTVLNESALNTSSNAGKRYDFYAGYGNSNTSFDDIYWGYADADTDGLGDADVFAVSGGTQYTGFADGSDATAAGTNWTTPTSAFNGDFRFTSGNLPTAYISSPNLNALTGDGVLIDDDGSTVTSVEVRCKSHETINGAWTYTLQVDTDGAAETLLTQAGIDPPVSATGSAADYSSWYTLSTPTGGWTLAKVQALEFTITPATGTSGALHIWGVQVRVTTSGVTAPTTGGDSLLTGSWNDVLSIPADDSTSLTVGPGMTAVRMAPNAMLAWSNLTGAVTDIDDDPDSPDGLWLTASGSSSLRVGFAAPAANPRVGAGRQNFRVLMRKNATGPGGSTEELVPTGLGGSDANLTGTAATIDDDPQAPGGDWRTASSDNSNSVCHATFNTPTGNPTGTQTFEVYARLTANGTACSYSIDLYETGTLVANVGSGTLTSTTGQLVTADWNASLLGTANGSAVECVFTVTKSGGSPGARTSGEVDAVRWVCPTAGTETQPGYSIQLYENGSQVVAVTPVTGNLTDAGGDTVAELSWDAAELGTADGSLVECYITQTSGADRYIEIGAVEWNSNQAATITTWVEADGGGSFAGPSGMTGLNNIAGMQGVWKARRSGTASSLFWNVAWGNDVDGLTNHEKSQTVGTNYLDKFTFTDVGTTVPLTTEHARMGMYIPSTSDVTLEIASIIVTLLDVPVTATTTPQQCLSTATGTVALTSNKTRYQLAALTGSAAPTYARVVDYIRQYPHSAVGGVAYDRVLGYVRQYPHGATGSAATVKMPTKNFAQSATGAVSIATSKFFTALLEITAVGTAALTRTLTWIKTLASSATGSVALLRNLSLAFAHAATGTVALIETLIGMVKQQVLITANGAVTLARNISKAFSSSAVGSSALVRGVSKIFSHAATGTAALTTTLVTIIVQQALITATASLALTRSVYKVLANSATATVDLTRNLALTFQSAATGTANNIRKLTLNVAAAMSATGSLVTQAQTLLTQTAAFTATGTTNLIRMISKSLVLTGAATVSLLRTVGKRLLSAATGTVNAAQGVLTVVTQAFSAIGSVFQQERFVGLQVQALITAAVTIAATKKVMKQFSINVRGRFSRIFPPETTPTAKAGLVPVPRRNVVRSLIRSLFRDL